MKNKILLLLMLLVSCVGMAQTYSPQDNPNIFRDFRGFIQAREGFRLPFEGGHSLPATDQTGFIRYSPSNQQAYIFNGTSWVGLGSDPDSTVFATTYSVDTAKAAIRQELQQKLDISDTADMLAGYVGENRFGDSLDSIRSAIADKQDQLDGIGWVRAFGTIIMYDNTAYTPESRTITINGVTQSLEANRAWTIPGTDTSNLREDIDALQDSIGIHRTDINGKEPAITVGTAAQYWRGDKTWQNLPTSLPPSGPAGGNLSGTYPNPVIDNNAVNNDRLADMAGNTIKGRIGSNGDPQDLTPAQVNTITGLSDSLLSKIDSVRTVVDSIFVKYGQTWYFAGKITAEGEGVAWGAISGTLSDQTDLVSALNIKLNIVDTTGKWLSADTEIPENLSDLSGNSDDVAQGGVNLYMTAAEKSKLSGIEAGADVTDGTNVAAAGAVMDTDFSANGIMARTASGTYASRTITGTSNQITVANGNGVSGNPVISLPSAVTTSLGLANSALQWSDTVTIATKYDIDTITRGGSTVDTTSLSNRINTKVTKGGDTAASGSVFDIGTLNNISVALISNNVRRLQVWAGDVRINQGSSVGLTVATNGNVAIGKLSNSGDKLEVVGGSTFDGTSTTTGFSARFRNSASQIIAQFNNNRTIQFGGYSGGDTALLAVDGSGNVIRHALTEIAAVKFNDQTGTAYTLTSADFDGRTIVKATNANPITITIPASIPVGKSVLVRQGGAGAITFVGGSGVILASEGSALTTTGTDSGVTIISEGSNNFWLTGRLQ